MPNVRLSKQKKILRFLYILFLAVTSISICSKSSFLYPFNDWMDANCFMTVGKSLLKGMIPYKDIYEQKGPLLYFISAIAARVSDTTFIGFWLVECVSAFFFLLFSYKTMRFFIGEYALFWVPVLACVVYSCGALSHGGSVEELCLPIFAYSFYVGVRYIGNVQKSFQLEMYIVGLLSACILWMKFSMLGFFLGWILVPFFLSIKEKQVKKFFVDICFILLGVITVTLPMLFWYCRNNALSDLMRAYFYNNIFVYSGGGAFQKARNLVSGLHLSLVYIPIPLFLAVFGVLFFIKKDGKLSGLFALSGLLAGLVIFSGGQGIQYYPLPLTSLSIIGLIAIHEIIEKKNWITAGYKTKQLICCLFLLASVCGMFFLSSNTPFMKVKKEELPQFQFREIIWQEKEPTLLNYGFMDGGFYTACGIYPDFKYFCKLNIALPEMLQAQEEYVAEKRTMFIVTRNQNPKLEGYECIAESSYMHESNVQQYYLYKLIG